MRFRKSPLVLVAAFSICCLLSFLATGCGQKSGPATTLNPDSLTVPADGNATDADAANLPSPVQMALSILNSKAPFNSELTNPVTKADGYTNTFSQAINLGIYQADLGYLIAHHQTQSALDYFRAVKKLGDKMGIFGAFDQSIMDRAEKNLDSRDSLFQILSEAFQNADVYLNENAMLASADLIVAGGWLESTYLATQILKTHDSGQLRKRIGDDKLVLPELLAVLEAHKESKEHIALASHFRELNTLYGEIKIKRDTKAAETDPDKKVTKIKSQTKVRYTKETLAKITEKVASIRKIYVN